MSISYKTIEKIGYKCRECDGIYEGAPQKAYRYYMYNDVPEGINDPGFDSDCFINTVEEIHGDLVWMCHDDQPCVVDYDSPAAFTIDIVVPAIQCSYCDYHIKYDDREFLRDTIQDFDDDEDMIWNFTYARTSYGSEDEAVYQMMNHYNINHKSTVKEPSLTNALQENQV